MIKEAFFPTIIYGKDLQLDTKFFEKEIVEQFSLSLLNRHFDTWPHFENDLIEKKISVTFEWTLGHWAIY